MRRGIPRVVAVAAGLLAGQATAQTVTPLASVDDLRSVCSAREPNRNFTVLVASRGFALEPYDARRARLAVDVARGLRGARGIELVMHDIASQAATTPGLDIAIPVDAGEASELASAHQRGELALRLTFQLSSPSDGSPVCAITLSTDGEGVRAAVEPLAFEILRGDVLLASGESARWSGTHDPSSSSVLAPRVVVSPPRLTHNGMRAPATVTRAATALTPGLLACYRLGLGDEPTLRGPFVAGVEVAPDGRVRAARAELDGLGAPDVTTCVLKLVRAARFPGAGDRLSIAMHFSD